MPGRTMPVVAGQNPAVRQQRYADSLRPSSSTTHQCLKTKKMSERTQFPPALTAISDCVAYEWRSPDNFRTNPKIGFVLPPKPILWAAGSVACHRRLSALHIVCARNW